MAGKFDAIKKILGKNIDPKLALLLGTGTGAAGTAYGISNLFDDDNTAGDSAAAGAMYGAGSSMNDAGMRSYFDDKVAKPRGMSIPGGSSKAALLKTLLGGAIGGGLGYAIGGDE